MTVVEAETTFTTEQLAAIERRDGDLLLDAGAGSGKTAVLVERFVRAVREDDVDVGQILAITFTDKAAAELRDRIRERLRELGDDERARATEGAWISTIHGFCARVLRAGALAAGIDPAFVVLDETEVGQLAEIAFEHALEAAGAHAPSTSGGERPGGEVPAIDLIAGYRVARLRRAIVGVHDELRSRGQRAPVLPPPPPVRASELDDARRALAAAHGATVAELAELGGNGSVADARGRLERCAAVLAQADPWLADIDAARLRNGSAGVLSGAACTRYRDALDSFRAACARREGARAHGLLDRLLRAYGSRYAELKRERSALDFEDLELLTRDLFAGNRELRGRYSERFAQIMVDELQDTNPVQLELIESIANENLFTVGDAYQSIYGFRHADVELFEQRKERLGAVDALATLSANFRSRPELLDALNVAFAPTFGDQFTPLRAGRSEDGAAPGPAVELLIVDKAADWGPSAGESSATWRLAEARALARRVHELVSGGAAPRDIVLLARATTDLRAYERALEDRGVPTYVIGGRGYWSHPQVLDLVSHLRALANPRDGQALYTVLASPLVAASSDALVVLAAAAREARRDPWWVLREPGTLLDDLAVDDRRRLEAFARWFSAERERAARASIEELIERALELTGYDLTMLAMPGGAAPGERAQADAPRSRVRVAPRARPARVPRSRIRSRERAAVRAAGERGAGGGRGARRSSADDHPPGQGARVRDRLRRRPRSHAAGQRRRRAPGRPGRKARPEGRPGRSRQADPGARLRHGRGGAGGGRGARGAPALLRRHDPRSGAVDPERRHHMRAVARSPARRRAARVDRARFCAGHRRPCGRG